MYSVNKSPGTRKRIYNVPSVSTKINGLSIHVYVLSTVHVHVLSPVHVHVYSSVGRSISCVA